MVPKPQNCKLPLEKLPLNPATNFPNSRNETTEVTLKTEFAGEFFKFFEARYFDRTGGVPMLFFSIDEAIKTWLDGWLIE